MQSLLKLLPWKKTVLITAVILLVVIILNFYGLYTNKFYFLRPDNYVFPVLSIVHFIYLYVIWFKISENELPDPKMRNLEYALYVVMIVYVYKIVNTFLILLSYSDYQNHMIPGTFVPMGILILLLYLCLPILALVTFKHRKNHIGHYNFENYNDNMNYWQ